MASEKLKDIFIEYCRANELAPEDFQALSLEELKQQAKLFCTVKADYFWNRALDLMLLHRQNQLVPSAETTPTGKGEAQ